jgi:hypothetical protein
VAVSIAQQFTAKIGDKRREKEKPIMTINTKFFVRLSVALLLANVSFSVYAKSLAPTPENICKSLQAAGLFRNCQAGTPWAFEVTKHEAQWEFEPTGSEIFKCYTVADGFTHVPCVFKGVAIQFSNEDDLRAGMRQIHEQNYRSHKQQDLQANVTRADTTLEHYVFEVSHANHLLVVLPVTEDLNRVLPALKTISDFEEL